MTTTPPSVPQSGRVGETRTCNPGAWSGSPTFAFQWLRDGAPIAGATSATYRLTGAILVAGMKVAGETLRGEEAFTQGTSNDVYLAGPDTGRHAHRRAGAGADIHPAARR